MEAHKYLYKTKQTEKKETETLWSGVRSTLARKPERKRLVCGAQFEFRIDKLEAKWEREKRACVNVMQTSSSDSNALKVALLRNEKRFELFPAFSLFGYRRIYFHVKWFRRNISIINWPSQCRFSADRASSTQPKVQLVLYFPHFRAASSMCAMRADPLKLQRKVWCNQLIWTCWIQLQTIIRINNFIVEWIRTRNAATATCNDYLL